MSRNDYPKDYQKAGDPTPLPRPQMTRVIDYVSAEDKAREIYSRSPPMESADIGLDEDSAALSEGQATESATESEGSQKVSESVSEDGE